MDWQALVLQVFRQSKPALLNLVSHCAKFTGICGEEGCARSVSAKIQEDLLVISRTIGQSPNTFAKLHAFTIIAFLLVIAWLGWLLSPNGRTLSAIQYDQSKRLRAVRELSARSFTQVAHSARAVITKVQRHTRKIPRLDERTAWFSFKGPSRISRPNTSVRVLPLDILPQPEDLYVHSYRGQHQIWMFTEQGVWKEVQEMYPHPRLPGYVLAMTDQSPRWVKEQTARKKLRARGSPTSASP